MRDLKQLYQSLKKDRAARWAIRILMVFISIAILSPMIANEKPFYCKYNGANYYPIFNEMLSKANLSKPQKELLGVNWLSQEFEFLLRAPIPYSETTQDKLNASYKSPFGSQNITENRKRHLLGTDKLGRDIFAGLIHGTRSAMMIGIFSMLIAGFIGIFFGTIAGYFGDDQVLLSIPSTLLFLLALFLSIIYGFVFPYLNNFGNLHAGSFLLKGLVISGCLFFGLMYFGKILTQRFKFNRHIAIPIDLIVMRFIEMFNAIPSLFLLLSLLALLKTQSIASIILIIGILSWTNIARFVRAEFLKIRSMDYIKSAKLQGISNVKILFIHGLPNAITPVLITLSFGVSAAILAEASLSFLGLGLAQEQVTWGSLLNQSRSFFSAWWLAIFPGIAIFMTILSCNIIGEKLTEILNPKI